MDMNFRIGNGFDVHRLVPERRLVMCGVDIPYELGLLGHSDADVALHALADALLGAAAMHDIGYHFPDTDPEYKGADSRRLLRRVVGIIGERGYKVGNVDITIIAQRPKMLPYIEQMRQNVAADLAIDVDAVSVKATTTERLGFTGRGEGIAAQATALIYKQ
ncbi:MAG: 2-C-methyl-D-erythritol 2,4-cyclodiphosphate synthase [Muribaculaceae bacterium]|nr:2-C-methyl-D-erythritol 2,4-cyclodiphosphate synthase [Muribaculaceae bacterium]